MLAEPARDRQTETCSAVSTRRRLIGLHELLEQFAHLFWRHADAGIGDHEIDPLAPVSQLGRHTQGDIAAFGELARIAQKIEKDLLQAQRIHDELAPISAGHSILKPVLVLLRQRSRGAYDLVDQRGDIYSIRD